MTPQQWSTCFNTDGKLFVANMSAVANVRRASHANGTDVAVENEMYRGNNNPVPSADSANSLDNSSHVSSSNSRQSTSSSQRSGQKPIWVTVHVCTVPVQPTLCTLYIRRAYDELSLVYSLFPHMYRALMFHVVLLAIPVIVSRRSGGVTTVLFL